VFDFDRSKLESMQAYSDHSDCPFCNPVRKTCRACGEEFTPELDEEVCFECEMQQGGDQGAAMHDVHVGDVVSLRTVCLGNSPGALGVVFYHYGDGCQVIFENGNYDGFSFTPNMPNEKDERVTEFDFFLKKIGHDGSVAGYNFTNVISVERAFNARYWQPTFIKFIKGGD